MSVEVTSIVFNTFHNFHTFSELLFSEALFTVLANVLAKAIISSFWRGILALWEKIAIGSLGDAGVTGGSFLMRIP